MATRRRLSGTIVVSALALGLTSVPAGAQARAKDTPLKVKRTTLRLVDASRAAHTNNDYTGAPDRTLETVVSYPTKKGKALTHPAADVVHHTTTAFLDAYVKGERGAVKRLVRDGDVPGVASIQAAP